VKRDSARTRRCRRGPRRAAVVAAVGGTVLLAACSGPHSSAPSAQPGQPTVQRLDAFARCMRSHGQPDFYFTRAAGKSSLSSTLTYIKIGPWVAQVNPGAPLNSALHACNHVLGLPAGPPPALTAAQIRSMVLAAACMRAHGYPDYPDPDIQVGRLVPQSLPTSIDTSSPRFQAALQTCHRGNA
jgi:hypothetical protein